MNIELKPHIDSFSVPAPARNDSLSVPAPANDNAERKRNAQSLRRVVIYQPAKSAITSGRAGTKRWLLEYEPQSAPFIEPLMGWTGSAEPMAQVRLNFPTREAAVAYAEHQGLDYEVRESARPGEVRVGAAKPQSQPMPLWPIESSNSEWHTLLVHDIGATGYGPGIAA